MTRIIKIDSIAIRYTRSNGQLLPYPELQLYVPYGLPGNGWFAGCFKFNMFDLFSVRSMFTTVKSS